MKVKDDRCACQSVPIPVAMRAPAARSAPPTPSSSLSLPRPACPGPSTVPSAAGPGTLDGCRRRRILLRSRDQGAHARRRWPCWSSAHAPLAAGPLLPSTGLPADAPSLPPPSSPLQPCRSSAARACSTRACSSAAGCSSATRRRTPSATSRHSCTSCSATMPGGGPGCSGVGGGGSSSTPDQLGCRRCSDGRALLSCRCRCCWGCCWPPGAGAAAAAGAESCSSACSCSHCWRCRCRWSSSASTRASQLSARWRSASGNSAASWRPSTSASTIHRRLTLDRLRTVACSGKGGTTGDGVGPSVSGTSAHSTGAPGACARPRCLHRPPRCAPAARGTWALPTRRASTRPALRALLPAHGCHPPPPAAARLGAKVGGAAGARESGRFGFVPDCHVLAQQDPSLRPTPLSPHPHPE